MKKIKCCALVVVTVFLAACQPAPQEPPPPYVEITKLFGGGLMSAMYRVIDKQAGVVCYTFNGNNVSCMPMKDTLLQK